MAELLKQELGVDAELIEGGYGEFTVMVDNQVAAKKMLFFKPSDEKVITAVRKYLQQ